MRRFRRTWRQWTLLAVLGVGVVGCTDDEDGGSDALTIYSSLPLQGDSRPQSKDLVRAIKMALREHERRAGDIPIRYVSLDDADEESGFPDPELAAANAERAAADPTAIAYIGEFNSSASRASIPLLNEAGILQISPSNTAVGLTRAEGAEPGEPDVYYPTGRRTYGRVVPAEHIQAAALVAYMQDKGCSSVYLLSDETDFGQGTGGQVKAISDREGLTIAADEELTDDTLPTLTADVEASGADCFFFGGITPSGAADLFHAAGAVVPDLLLFGADGIAESAFTNDIDPDVAVRTFITNPTLPPGSYPGVADAFFEAFESAYGHPPEPYAIYGYEAMNLALLLIERAGDSVSADAAGRAAVVAQLFQVEDRDSVLGTYSIDQNGDTTLAQFGGYTIADDELIFDAVVTAVAPVPSD